MSIFAISLNGDEYPVRFALTLRCAERVGYYALDNQTPRIYLSSSLSAYSRGSVVCGELWECCGVGERWGIRGGLEGFLSGGNENPAYAKMKWEDKKPKKLLSN